MRASRFAALGVLLLLASAPPGHAATGRPSGLPWIADDYAKARAEARARKVPIFVESWAPW